MKKLVVGIAIATLSACGGSAKPAARRTTPSKPPPAEEKTAGPKVPPPASTVTPISSLTVDASRQVTIKGYVSALVGLRMVPERTIFKVRDKTGEVLAVIEKRDSALQEGLKLEIVGTYKMIPSPMYTGPGKAPQEAVLVVDRYLTLQ